jgi:IS30 family transposase
VSHETNHHCICAQPVGELKRELVAALRHAHNKRVPRSKGQDRRGHIPDMVSIHIRPPEIEKRHLPGHWEGDLIKGAGNASAANVMLAFTDKLLGIAAPMRLSKACDQGKEVAIPMAARLQ